MGSSQKVVKGVIWTSIYNVVAAIYGFIAVPILIKYFGKAEYGLIGLAMSVNVYMRLMDLGFNSTNVRFFSTWLAQHNYDKLKNAFQTSLSFYGIIGLLNGIVLLVVAFLADHIFQVTPEQAVILRRLFYILSFSAFCNWYSSCFDQLIKATENVAWIQRRQLIPKLLQILVLCVTVYGELNITAYYLLTCLATISILPLSIGKIRTDLSFISFLPSWNKQVFREMLPYCLNIFSFSLFQFSFYNLRPVFLAMQGSVESVTDFQVINSILQVVNMLGNSFTAVLLPSTSKVVARHDKASFYKVAYQGTKYISISLCFFAFCMISVSLEVLKLYVGESFLYLSPWLILMLLCGLVGHNQAISSLIMAGADLRAISYSSAVSSIVGLIVSWFAIPTYQVGGVVIGFFCYGMIQMLFYYLYYWPKKMEISSSRILFRCFGPFAVLGTVLALVIMYLPHTGNAWLDFFLFAALFAVVYAAVTWTLLDTTDRQFFLGIIRRKSRTA